MGAHIVTKHAEIGEINNGFKEVMAQISKRTLRSSTPSPFVGVGPSPWAFFFTRFGTRILLLFLLCTILCLVITFFSMDAHRISLSSTEGSISKEPEHPHQSTCAVRRGLLADDHPETDDDFFLWQFCPNNNNTTETMVPKSILFLAHGCNHHMGDWWLPSNDAADCPDCYLGLPEERAIVKAALDRNFLVVALSSLQKCWSAMDGTRVTQVLVRLQQQQQQQKWSNKNTKHPPPLLAFGASSGGHFVSTILPQTLQQHGTQLEGFISEIMATSTPIEKSSHNASLPKAVGYIVMSRDTRTDQQAQRRVQEWKALGVPVQYRQVKPLAIDKNFFASRIPEIGHSLSWKLFQALRNARLLNSEGYLTHNPRLSDWRSVLEPVLSRDGGHYKDTLINDQSPLSEVMNVAWGEHEMTREGVEESFDFLLKNL